MSETIVDDQTSVPPEAETDTMTNEMPAMTT